MVGEVFGDLIIEGRVGWGEGVGSDAVRGRCLRERVGRGGLPGGASWVAHWAERGCDGAGDVFAVTVEEEKRVKARVVVESVRDWKHLSRWMCQGRCGRFLWERCVNRLQGVVDTIPLRVGENSKREWTLHFKLN